MFTRSATYCLTLIAALIISSCGGGGGGSAPPADEASGGIWLGEWDTGPGNDISAAAAFSTDVDPDTGEARFSMLVYPALVQIAGTLQVDGTSATGSGTAYTTVPGDSFPGGATRTGFSFTGTISEGQFVRGDWTIDAGDSGSFDLDYDAQHLRGADLARLDGLWTVCEFNVSDELCPNPMGTFDILDGMIFRQTGDCTSMGTITIPDPQYNMYEWSATVTSNAPGSCFIEGDYSGLGALTDSEDESPVPLNDEFDVLVNSDRLAIPLLLILDP